MGVTVQLFERGVCRWSMVVIQPISDQLSAAKRR